MALTASVSAQARELVSRAMESSPASSARLDGSVRETLLEVGRLGLESGMEKDRSDCGAANAPRCGQCGGGMRYAAAGAVFDGDGAGHGSAGDGALRVRGLRGERASAGGASGH